MLIGLLVAASLRGQDTVRLSLPQVFEHIDETHPQLHLYQNRIRSIRALAEGAKSWMPPTVSVALDQFPYRKDMEEETMPVNLAGYMLSVQQMIPNPAKLNARKRYILSQENVLRQEEKWAKNVLHYTARVYYYSRYTAEKKLVVVSEYSDLLRMLITTAKDRYVYNQSDLPTVFKAEALLSELNNMETMLRSQVAESSIGLNTLMSRDVDTPFLIDSVLQPTDYQRDLAVVADSSFLKRSDILAVESRIQSMRSNQRLMATGAKPDFGIQFNHSQMNEMPNTFSVMGMVTIPIAPWASRMYKSEVRSMEFDIRAMENEKATMQLMANQMIREKITMLAYESRQLQNYQTTIIPAYRNNLQSNLLAYRQNTGNFFVLLDAWNMLLMKEMERIDKLGQVFNLQAEYEYQREIN